MAVSDYKTIVTSNMLNLSECETNLIYCYVTVPVVIGGVRLRGGVRVQVWAGRDRYPVRQLGVQSRPRGRDDVPHQLGDDAGGRSYLPDPHVVSCDVIIDV